MVDKERQNLESMLILLKSQYNASRDMVNRYYDEISDINKKVNAEMEKQNILFEEIDKIELQILKDNVKGGVNDDKS